MTARVARALSALPLVFALAALAGCGGKPFNVKPRPATAPPAAPINYEVRAEGGSAVVEATAIRDEDLLYETFDANLIMAGILPVRVMITSSSAEPIDLERARFEIRTADRRRYKAVDAGKAYKRLISYYGISTYSEAGYEESKQDFSSHAIDLEPPLLPGESRAGMLFFLLPDDSMIGRSLTLTASRLAPKKSKDDRVMELDLN